MNKNFKGLLLILMLILFIPFFSACGKTDNPNKNDEDEKDYYLNCLESGAVTLTVDDTYQIKYETNIEDEITWEVFNNDIIKVDDKGFVTALSRGKAFVNAYYFDLTFEVEINVEPKKVIPPTYKLTIFGYDEITIKNRGLTLYIYLKNYYGNNLYRDYEDLLFKGYYLDDKFTKPVDYQTKLYDNLTIYPKYVKDETKSDANMVINNVLIHNSEVVIDDKIQAFSADFGDTVKYNDLTYEDCMFVEVRYIYNDNAKKITNITIDGNKQNTKIPYDGFILMIPKSYKNYNTLKDTLKVNDTIDLDKYSINVASKCYVNKEYVKHADPVNLNNINCEFISVYDMTNDTMLYQRNNNSVARPASTTKIITALAALQHTSLDTVVTIGDELDLMNEGSDPGTAGLHKGEKWTIRQLLYAMLLPSGNDAAYSVGAGAVRSIPGNENKPIREIMEIFRGWMNDVKDQVGAKDSHFMVPDGNSYYKNGGWDERLTDHYVTSDDMIKFAKLAFNYPGIALVTSTYNIKFTTVSGQQAVYSNTNQLLRIGSQYYYPYAVGMKTGTTTPAGSCLIAGAEKDGRFIIVSILKNYDSRFYNAKKIFETVLK